MVLILVVTSLGDVFLIMPHDHADSYFAAPKTQRRSSRRRHQPYPITMTSWENRGAGEPLFGQQVPTYNGEGIKVQDVTTDEEQIAVPVATSVPVESVPVAPKPPREHVHHRSVQSTEMDSGESYDE